MSTQADRKLELERKKAKLALIREEKKRKEVELRQMIAGRETTPEKDVGEKSQKTEEVEKMLVELGISPGSGTTPSGDDGASGDGDSTRVSPDRQQLSTAEAGASTMLYKTRGRVNLQKSELVQVNMQPKEQVLYSKTTQTTVDPALVDKDLGPHTFEWEDEFHAASVGVTASGSVPTSPTEEVPGGDKNQMTVVEEEKKPKMVSLTEDEKRNIMTSTEFHGFFDRASRIVQRAMIEEMDIFVDYAKELEQEKMDSGAKLSLSRCFYDDKWTKNRCVTAFDYSPQHPELLAVAYNNGEDCPHEPDGVVLVWNTKFKTVTPEYIFHCHSRVLSVSWAKFHPNLLLGGTYNGQICLWDNRNNKRTPVQKSPLSALAHTHPVYCAQVVGTQNSHSLVTVSTDGKLCTWSLDMLAKPQETLELNMGSKQTKQVTATALSFPQNDVNNFMIGSEEGTVYAGCRHGQKAGIVEPLEGHSGPITGLDYHASLTGQVDFSNLFLTSSFDWTVKLWNNKEPRPLYSFEDHSDYVFDVAWSPIHPALFACVDGRGRIDLWQLNQDTEVPAASLIVPDSPALNRLIWLQSGHQLAIGDDNGRVWIYDVNEQLANPRQNEWQTFAKTLHELKQSQTDMDDVNNPTGVAISPRL